MNDGYRFPIIKYRGEINEDNGNNGNKENNENNGNNQVNNNVNKY
jgi:hypothetical protein